MKTIWKFLLPLSDTPTKLTLPRDAKLVMCDEQQSVPTLWFMLDPDAAFDIEHTYRVFGTGQPIPDEYSVHIGSFKSGPFVWHILEEGTIQ